MLPKAFLYHAKSVASQRTAGTKGKIAWLCAGSDTQRKFCDWLDATLTWCSQEDLFESILAAYKWHTGWYLLLWVHLRKHTTTSTWSKMTHGQASKQQAQRLQFDVTREADAADKPRTSVYANCESRADSAKWSKKQTCKETTGLVNLWGYRKYLKKSCFSEFWLLQLNQLLVKAGKATGIFCGPSMTERNN